MIDLVRGVAACGVLFLLACETAAPVIEGTGILHDTLDAQGPYAVTTVVHAQDGVKLVEVLWQLEGQQGFQSVPMSASGEVWQGAIPGPGAPAHLLWFVRATGEDGRVATDPAPDHGDQPVYSFRVLPPSMSPDGGVVARPCSGDADCLTTEVCNLEIGQCVPR